MEVAGDIRKAFAKAHKMKEEYFTFNGKGACPVCGGKGVIVSEMAFMDAIETTCEACGGLRYAPEALAYTVTGATGETLNIAQVMDLSVRLASAFFKGTVIEQKLRPLVDVGLQYLHLNQALSTLSGGELQRLKLASYLGVEGKIFIIDEPTDHHPPLRHPRGPRQHRLAHRTQPGRHPQRRLARRAGPRRRRGRRPRPLRRPARRRPRLQGVGDEGLSVIT